MKTVPKKKVSRRALLRGAGTTGLLLPFLESVPERSAFAQNEDPRFAFFICGANGVVQKYGDEPERFWPTEPGPLTKEKMLADSVERCTGLLADYADQLLIVSGMRYPDAARGDTHAEGHTMCLTGLPCEGTSIKATSKGPSVDWVIAEHAGGVPLNTYAGMKSGYVDDKLSFRSAGELVIAEPDPKKVYLELAGLLDGTGAESAMALELARRRKSVNDLVREDLQGLLSDPRLSSADRQRLELHLSVIRDIEVSMERMGCSEKNLSLDEILTIGPKGYIEDVVRLQMQLVGVAFSCNMTRAATLQWGDGGGDGTFYIIDGEKLERFHFISHRVRSDGFSGEPIVGAAEMHAKIDRVRMGTFKTLLDHWRLLSTPQGNLLDSAFAMWTTDVAVGPTGSFQNLPVIIAGSAGGRLRQGEYLKLPAFNNTRLLKSFLEVCGVDSSGFAASENVEPLSEVLA